MSKKLDIIKQIEETKQKNEPKIKHLYEIDGLSYNEDGKISKSLPNLLLLIENNPLAKELGFNEFTQEITIEKEAITDIFIDEIRFNIARSGVTYSEGDIYAGLNLNARDNSYHPIKQMIESKHWDGVERAETLFIDYLGANDDKYIRESTRKWLAGSVARVYQPGIKFEVIPILQGKQGIGKSTIASRIGGTYFTDSLQGLGNTKDDYQMLIGTWIAELGELSSLSSTKVETIKGFTSAREDKIRLPYGKMTQKFKRTVSFIGTTNPKEYLKDLTGNRRFFPMPLDESRITKDVFKLDDATIQQIWAEAYCYYKAGEPLFIPNDDYETLELAKAYRDEATEQDMVFIDIEDYLNMTVAKDWNTLDNYEKRVRFLNYKERGEKDGLELLEKTTLQEILSVVFNLENTDRQQKGYSKKIKLYMDELESWEYKAVYMNGKTRKGYMREW
ncbi:MAG: virulence-associated E family protein [Staphylococcus equorum]|nr:virulence-associated E family protein [Atopostipes sp.]MDN6195678.1 virulence-associated E family protein [Atopostipes suicloacalis]MDN6750313.1 virulence-associated E family protein [Staphylococcus equorum]